MMQSRRNMSVEDLLAVYRQQYEDYLAAAAGDNPTVTTARYTSALLTAAWLVACNGVPYTEVERIRLEVQNGS